jgi:hypothetical protein
MGIALLTYLMSSTPVMVVKTTLRSEKKPQVTGASSLLPYYSTKIGL